MAASIRRALVQENLYKDGYENEVHRITGGRHAILENLAVNHRLFLESPNVPSDAEWLLVNYLSKSEVQLMAFGVTNRLINVWRVLK